MGRCHGASVQAVPSGRGDWSPWNPLCRSQRPPGTRSLRGERGPLPAAGAQRSASQRVVAGGWAPPPVMRRRGLRRRCPPRRVLGLGLRRSKCLPRAGRQGGAGAARCAAALGRRRRTGARGVRGARWAVSARALCGRRGSRDRPWGPGAQGAVR
nr:PREDICTED: uncharacterized protein LOC107130461 [Macaca fascicularis]